MRAIYIVSIILLIEGCSIKEVKPWEKGTLAKDIMKRDGGNSLFSKFKNHIYFSKEASKGGGGVAGGGCGCN
jgi:hypothetical protein